MSDPITSLNAALEGRYRMSENSVRDCLEVSELDARRELTGVAYDGDHRIRCVCVDPCDKRGWSGVPQDLENSA